MSPLYEYRCPACKAEFERITEYEHCDSITCPDCGILVDRRVSAFLTSSTMNHKFFKEGEGFSSVTYSPEEYKERVKGNLGKYDPI